MSNGEFDNDEQGRNSPPNIWELHTRLRVLESTVNTLKDELHKINANLSRIMWVILTAIILAILNLIIRGGI